MSQPELLKRTVHVLDDLGIPFMLTGSLVSSLQGEPRSTHDIDVVVDFPADRIDDLLREFPPPAFFLHRPAIQEAILSRSMFNLLDTQEGDKVDFWLLTSDPFDQSRFARRIPVDFEDVRLVVSTPEDTILMKLRWSQEVGGSERQFRDAVRVFEIQSHSIDTDYLMAWVLRLGLEAAWRRLLDEAKPLKD